MATSVKANATPPYMRIAGIAESPERCMTSGQAAKNKAATSGAYLTIEFFLPKIVESYAGTYYTKIFK
jgi:hypothetical protein